MAVDRAAAARAIEAFLVALGHHPGSQAELNDTPRRVADAWADDLLDGYDVNVEALLTREAFAAPAGSQAALVAVNDLSVCTVCPHHLLPARGKASVLYLPGERVTGFGTIARLVDAWAHRLAFQEAIGGEVASSLIRVLGAKGAACKLVLSHDCLGARGERQTGALVETLAVAGSFAEPGADRELLLRALGAPR